MKHILPIITITTLAAAASAQSAAASSGLSYNSVSATYVRSSYSGNSGHYTDYVIGAQAMIGQSNFLISASSVVGGTNNNTGWDRASLGYVFKNVQSVADVTVFIGSYDTVGINVRKELGNNLEVSANYARQNREENDVYGIAVGYTFNKVYTLDLGWSHTTENKYGSSSANALSAGLRYNF